MLTKILCFRITPFDDEALVQLSARLGEKNRTRLVRKLIRETLGMGPYLMAAELMAVKESVRALNAIGINLNQLTRAVNSGVLRVTPPELKEAIEKLSAATLGLKKEWSGFILRLDKPVARGRVPNSGGMKGEKERSGPDRGTAGTHA